MTFCRLAATVFALAFIAGPAVAQVMDSPVPPSKAQPAADSLIVPKPADGPIAPPTIQVSQVPEPGSILLLAAPAAAGWVAYWRRKWRAEPADKGPTDQP
jgi:hypothetical protein